jgi:hypothetical protein
MTDAHTITRTLAGLAVIALLASTAQAQSNVAATAKFCYAENAGWMNWRDAGSPRFDASGSLPATLAEPELELAERIKASGAKPHGHGHAE